MFIETFILTKDRKFLTYIPDPNAPITVYVKRDNDWSIVPFAPSLNLIEKDKCYYLQDINCIYFHVNFIGREIKVEYLSTGVRNPFLIHEFIDITERMIELSNYYISSSIYIVKSDIHEFGVRLKGGTIYYDGNIYVIDDQEYNFQLLGLPSVPGKYYGYLIYVGSDTIQHNFYAPLKQLTPSIVRTVYTYDGDTLYQAEGELLSRARSRLLKSTDPLLELAYIFVTVSKGSTEDEYQLEFQVTYKSTHRKI